MSLGNPGKLWWSVRVHPAAWASVSSSDGTGCCSHMPLCPRRSVTSGSLAAVITRLLSLIFFHLWLFCDKNVPVLLPSKHFDSHPKIPLSGFISIVIKKVKFMKYKLAILKWRMWEHLVHSQYRALNISVQCKTFFSHPQGSLYLLGRHYTSPIPQACSRTLPTGLSTSVSYLMDLFIFLHSLYKWSHAIQSLWGSSVLYHVSRLESMLFLNHILVHGYDRWYPSVDGYPSLDWYANSVINMCVHLFLWVIVFSAPGSETGIRRSFYI